MSIPLFFKNATRKYQSNNSGTSGTPGCVTLEMDSPALIANDNSTEGLEYEALKDNENLIISDHQEELIIKNCSSVEESLALLPTLMRDYFLKCALSLVVCFRVRTLINDFNAEQFSKFIQNFLNFKRSFLICFTSLVDNSCLIFWRVKDHFPIYKLKIDLNNAEVGGFVKDFLIKSIKEKHNGLHSLMKVLTNQLTQEVFVDMLSDIRPYNLLFLAAEAGKSAIVEVLVKHFNVNQEINRKSSVDLAFEANCFETISVLIKANSRFPNNFQVRLSELPFRLRHFIITFQSMHDAIASSDREQILSIINENPDVKYFFNDVNRSALASALRKKKFEVYKVLVSKNIALGPHENFENIIENYNEEELNELTEFNRENSSRLTEPFILTILANSIVGLDDEFRDTRSVHVLKAFTHLSTIPEVKILLQLLALFKDFQIIFDFNRTHVQFLDPRQESYVNGLFNFNGRIYIGAMHLLDESMAHEVYGVIAHEVCHFVMFNVFKNMAKPYTEKDTEGMKNFQRIRDYCWHLRDADEIIRLVYDCYPLDQQHAELIVRIPHLLGHYFGDEEKIKEIKQTFSDLYRFYATTCMPKLEEKLKELEEEERKPKIEIVEPIITKKFYCCDCCITIMIFFFLFLLICLGVLWFAMQGMFSSECDINIITDEGLNAVCLNETFLKTLDCYENIEDGCFALEVLDDVAEVIAWIFFIFIFIKIFMCIFKLCQRK